MFADRFNVRRRLAAFRRARAGNVAIVFALAAPVLGMLIGGGVDYSRFMSARSAIRSVADGAALAGAQSLRVANATAQTTAQVVSAYVAAHSGGASISVATTVTNSDTVSVSLTQDAPTQFGRFVGVSAMRVAASATARITGNAMPICMVALDPSAGKAMSVEKANVTATGCQLFANSSAADAFGVADGGGVAAGQICSHGGFLNNGASAVSPSPRTDCPVLNDPLGARAQPSVGSCTFNNLKITSGSQSLSPGVYCGGLEVSGGASVTLMAGIYVISGGALLVKANSSLSGTDVTIFLTGSGATLAIENKSTISLAAPSTGAMAGMLIFEDRASPVGQQHKFESRTAPQMLGTIYLPRGSLQIGVSGAGGGAGVAVGSSSAWTVVIARQISITDQQTLTLNSNYGATTVPPPPGLGPGSGPVTLTQ